MDYQIAKSIAEKNGVQLSEVETRSLPTFSFNLNAISLTSSSLEEVDKVVEELELAKKQLLSTYRKYEYDCLSIAYALFLLATIRNDDNVQSEKLFAVIKFGEKLGIEGILNQCTNQLLTPSNEKMKWAKDGEVYSRIAFEISLEMKDTLLVNVEEHLYYVWTRIVENK